MLAFQTNLEPTRIRRPGRATIEPQEPLDKGMNNSEPFHKYLDHEREITFAVMPPWVFQDPARPCPVTACTGIHHGPSFTCLQK